MSHRIFDKRIAAFDFDFDFDFAFAFASTVTAVVLLASLPAGSQTATPAHIPQSPQQVEAATLAKRNKQVTPKAHNTTEIPTNFPIAMYKNNVQSTNFVNSVKGTVVAAASIVTLDKPADVFKWYQMQCENSGWLVANYDSAKLPQKIRNRNMYILHAKKAKQEMTITCCNPGKTQSTIVNVSWMKVAQ